MPYAHVNTIRLHYEAHGNGDETLLIVPGLGGNTLSWTPPAPTFDDRFRVVVVDNRGAGLSDKPSGPYSMAQFADDAVALLDHLAIERAHVLGESMGGMIAQHVALRHPRRVRRLVLLSTTPGGPNAVRADPTITEAMVATQELPPEVSMELSFRLSYTDDFVDANRDLLIARTLASAHLQPPMEAYMAQLRSISEHDTYARLPEITHPTLVIHGTEDRIIPTANGELLARGIPDAELLLLHGGHGVKLEAREQIQRVALNFLQNRRAGP